MGCAVDIPRHRPCPDYAEVGRVGYPGMADRDKYWRVRAFNNRGTIPINQDLQDVYVGVWEKAGISRDHPGFEMCLIPTIIGSPSSRDNVSLERTQPQRDFMYHVARLRRSARSR